MGPQAEPGLVAGDVVWGAYTWTESRVNYKDLYPLAASPREVYTQAYVYSDETRDLTMALGPDDGALASLIEDRPERVGAYRVLDVLGEGGMGVVYLAEQASPSRRVALKVIRSGAPAKVARLFEREGELLAGSSALVSTG